MKQLILCLLLAISTNGWCDTIDYWNVYLNDKLIGEFNANSKDLTIKISKKELKETDVITLRYGTDHPCVDCYYGVIVLTETKSSSPEAITKEHYGKLSISVQELLQLNKRNGMSKFPFNYYERSNTVRGSLGRLTKENEGRLVFILLII